MQQEPVNGFVNIFLPVGNALQKPIRPSHSDAAFFRVNFPQVKNWQQRFFCNWATVVSECVVSVSQASVEPLESPLGENWSAINSAVVAQKFAVAVKSLGECSRTRNASVVIAVVPRRNRRVDISIGRNLRKLCPLPLAPCPVKLLLDDGSKLLVEHHCRRRF